MEKNEILPKLTAIAKDIFDNENIMLAEETTANDVTGWDSLTHIQFVVAIEKAFKVRFASREIQSWNNIREMITCIESKLQHIK